MLPGFDVAVDDPFGMRGIQCVGNLNPIDL
jgi:hypothetical protein